METDASCGTCNGLFQPLDLEKSFFQGLPLSRGRTDALFMAVISTVNSCLVITACHTFPPQSSPPPIFLHFRVSCSFAKLKVCLFWSPREGSIPSWREHGDRTGSRCVWRTRQNSPFCIHVSPCQQWSWFYLHIKRKVQPPISPQGWPKGAIW